MSDNNALRTRDQIEDKDKWAIRDLYDNDEQWDREYTQVESLLPKLASFEGKITSSAQKLYEFLTLKDETSLLLERLIVYSNQRYHEDTANAVYQRLSDKASMLAVNYERTISFFSSEIMKLQEETLERFYQELPEFTFYKRYLSNLFRKKPHILSEAEERLLAAAGEIAEAPATVFSMFNNADIKFSEIMNENNELVALTHGRYTTFLQSKDRRVRKEAFEAMYAPYMDNKNTLAALFAANLKQENFYAKARKYDSSMAMELDDSNIPIKVYDNLIDVVHEKLPLLHRYMAIRKKYLGLDELHMYDLYVPMVADVPMKISFDEAKKMVQEGLKPLGKEYGSILQEGYNNGWIDIYENQGKRSGAYSWGAYGTHPYVLLNFQDNLNNTFTLCHEMGHAIHSYYSDHNQKYVYAGYKIFVAEVASTCNEALLMQHLLKITTDKQKRAYLLNYQLEQFRTTLYRQTMFAEFEKITHGLVTEGEPLTAESLSRIYHDLNVKYFGEDVVVDNAIDMEWARIPHFYNPFYVYQYATGYSAAIALSKRILHGGDTEVEDYVNFLKGGSSKDPIDLLKGAGVDMMKKKPVEDALAVFEELLNEIEELL